MTIDFYSFLFGATSMFSVFLTAVFLIARRISKARRAAEDSQRAFAKSVFDSITKQMAGDNTKEPAKTAYPHDPLANLKPENKN